MRRFKYGSQILFLIICLLINALTDLNLSAAPLHFEPVSKSLPDGSVINIFISGDEFFNYLHDSNGFPLGKGDDGYYYYLIQKGDNFIPTTYRYATEDPYKIAGMKKVTIPSWVPEKAKEFNKTLSDESKKKGVQSINKSAGVFNNLVIYIKFLNEANFTVARSAYDVMMNSTTESSLRYYNREISYNLLDVVSYSYPEGSTSDICYTDNNTRSYYQPYNASTNTDGYRNDSERTLREHSLLATAISWAKGQSPLPAGVDFDVNHDGIIDNICFIVKGTYDGWNDLLWPHRWALYSQTVTIGGLNVYGYTFQLENVNVNTLCHEMLHALGAPDLYHYNNDLRPVGPWDIMAEGRCHPGAWMKYKYGGWIDNIPEIKTSGTYVLKPLTQRLKNAYIIRSPYRSDQFIIVEFRKKSGLYESSLPESGMIIQRITPDLNGNSSGPPDEIYVYRIDGTSSSDGVLNFAAFTNTSGRTSFSDKTNPAALFSGGSVYGINIKDIKMQGDSMLFTIEAGQPVDLVLQAIEDTKISARWKSLITNDFLVAASTTSETIKPSPLKNYQPGDTIGSHGFVVQNGPAKTLTQSNLKSDEIYYFTVWAVTGESPYTYSTSVRASQRTGIYTIQDFPYVENFDEVSTELPRGWKAQAGYGKWELYNSGEPSFLNSLLLLNPSLGIDEWIYTPGFLLSAGVKYMITFNYRNKTKSVKESLFLGGGTTRLKTGMNQLNLFTSENFDYTDVSLFKSVFVSPSSATYYLGFRTGTITEGVLVDNFRIEEVPKTTVQHSEPIEFYPNPSNGIITIPTTGLTEITVFSSGGIRIYSTSIESMRVVDLSFLGKGMYFVRFKTNEKTVTGKIIII
jgi:M6 family metalloprotease-like protein